MAMMRNPHDRAEMDALRPQIEALQWYVARQLLRRGLSVVLENGYWSRAQRQRYLDEGRAAGARVVLHYLPVEKMVLLHRIRQRNPQLEAAALRISDEEVDTFLGWFEAPEAHELESFDEAHVY